MSSDKYQTCHRDDVGFCLLLISLSLIPRLCFPPKKTLLSAPLCILLPISFFFLSPLNLFFTKVLYLWAFLFAHTNIFHDIFSSPCFFFFFCTRRSGARLLLWLTPSAALSLSLLTLFVIFFFVLYGMVVYYYYTLYSLSVYSVVTVSCWGSIRTLLSCLIWDAVWRWLEPTGSNQPEKNLHPSRLCHVRV